MFSSVPSSWSSVSSWLGVGQRPNSDGEDDKKDKDKETVSKEKETLNSDGSSSKEGVEGSATTQSDDQNKSPESESSQNQQQSPLNIDSLKDLNLEEVSQKALSHAKDIGSKNTILKLHCTVGHN